ALDADRPVGAGQVLARAQALVPAVPFRRAHVPARALRGGDVVALPGDDRPRPAGDPPAEMRGGDVEHAPAEAARQAEAAVPGAIALRRRGLLDGKALAVEDADAGRPHALDIGLAVDHQAGGVLGGAPERAEEARLAPGLQDIHQLVDLGNGHVADIAE